MRLLADLSPMRRLGIGWIAGGMFLMSCGWQDAGQPVPKSSKWERMLPWSVVADPEAMEEIRIIVLSKTDSASSGSGVQLAWAFYCNEEIQWSRRFRITNSVEPTWMDDSRYMDVEFPSGPGVRLHLGNPGIATPLFGDLRDTAFRIPDGNVDTAEFNRRKLPCGRQDPVDVQGKPLHSPLIDASHPNP